MRYLCSSLVIIVVPTLALSAQPALVSEERWLEESRQILESAAAQPAPAWLEQEPPRWAKDEAQAIADDVAADLAEARPPPTQRLMIFASLSIPAATLKELLAAATEADAVLIFRGIPENQTIPSTTRKLRELLPEGFGVPRVIIHPGLFHQFDVKRVPSFVLARGERPAVKVRGAVSAGWIRRMAASVSPGQEDLGKRAEDYDIAEPDLIAEMQRRLARVDWAERRDAAVREFWVRRPPAFVNLPDAKAERTYFVDPAVRVTADISDASGETLVRSGETFNPLRWVAMPKVVVVFKGTDTAQVKKASELVATIREGGREVILLTTAIDTGRGWDHFNELEKTFATSVSVLPRSLVDQFHLQAVPATVTAQGERLMVKEVPIRGEP